MGARPRPADFHFAAFLRAIPASTGFSSIPSTLLNGSSEASSIARPIPAPASTNVNSSTGAHGLLLCHLRISPRNTDGATPK